MSGYLIFDTHPIPYRSPVFQAVSRRASNLRAYFFNERFDGNKWWFQEVGKIPKQTWERPLRDGFASEVVGTERLGLTGSYRRLRTILEREKPSAVLLYGYYLPEHWTLRLLCARRRIPIVFVGETFADRGSLVRRAVKQPLRRFFFGGVKQFIAIGDKTRSYYRSLRIPDSRIVGAKYCADISFYSLPEDEAAATRARWRASLNVPEDAFVQLFVGRLFERKRPHDMIALHRRLKAHPSLYTVIVGNGPLEHALRIEGRAEDRLVFAGFRNQTETREAYHGSDLLVMPSEYETWGLVVNEAFACRRPALVTDRCGTAGDLVVPGRTGFVFPVGEIGKAASEVERLLGDRALLAALGQQAQSKVTAEYGIDQFADAILNAFGRASKESGSIQPPAGA